MLLILATAKKKDERKYEWYIYMSPRKAKFNSNEHADLEFSLVKGEKFGVRKFRGKWCLIDGEERKTEFKLKDLDMERIFAHSKGWEGKIGRSRVKAGTEGHFGLPKRVDDDGFIIMKADSAVARRILYNNKTKRLRITFPKGYTYEYYDVDEKVAKGLERNRSQGRYFVKHIRPFYDYARISEG